MEGQQLTSIVLPVHNQADHIEAIVAGYRAALGGMPGEYEFVLVTNACTDASPEICARIIADQAQGRHIDIEEGGWGRAVKTGLAAADGDVLCYTNSARTTPEILTLMLSYAQAYSDVVLKANRRIRESFQRRIGSLIYNLECRMLFDLASWDINGTPKIFPRRFGRLLALERDDDLIDAEFAIVCKQEDYPMIEVPILATERRGGASTTGYRSAMRLYLGAWRMKRSLRKQSEGAEAGGPGTR